MKPGPFQGRRAPARARGFTLIELLMVVALIAVASGVASLAMRDPQATQLEREAARLSSLLESARAHARGAGLAVQWIPTPAAPDSPPPADGQAAADFRFVGLPTALPLPSHWLARGTVAEVVGARGITLGPEPLIGAQRLVLRLGNQAITLATDGLSPFTVIDSGSAAERAP